MEAALKRPLLVVLVLAISSGEGARLIRHGDDIDVGMRTGGMLKMLREMAEKTNATAADTLNLPANASSIRENITDTFSCENRTYGYYADVDNDCQIFHVCLTSQTYSGRNVTRRWSFICPNETIFNQEVLTCTRPEDSIDCADSPMYYDRNDDIGKVNNTSSDDTNNSTTTPVVRNNPNYNIVVNTKKKEINKRKQNIVMAEEIMIDNLEKMMPNDDKRNNNNDSMKKKETKRKQNIAMAEDMEKEDEREEMMANGMPMEDDKKENMMEANKNEMMNRKEVKRKQNIAMADAMMTNGKKKYNNIVPGMDKEGVSINPMAEMMAHSMIKERPIKIPMTDTKKKDNDFKQDNSKKKEDGYRKPMKENNFKIDVMKKQEETNKKLMTDAMNVELTDMTQDTDPVIEEVISDFEMYNQGDRIKDPMNMMNERMALERSLKRNGKRIKKRSSFRFKADT